MRTNQHCPQNGRAAHQRGWRQPFTGIVTMQAHHASLESSTRTRHNREVYSNMCIHLEAHEDQKYYHRKRLSENSESLGVEKCGERGGGQNI